MYRVLIVDDEPRIVNGLYYYLHELKHHDLELHKTTDAFEALEMFDKYRMDIAILDIEMPDMSGIELQQRILAKWPRCKIIFLTGHHEFENIQTALRQGSVDYILKAEGYGKVKEVLENTIVRINDELQNENFLNRAKKNLDRLAPYLWKEYLHDLLHEAKSSQVNAGKFAEIDLPLDPSIPVLLIIGKIDFFGEHFSFYEKKLMQFALQNIAEEYFKPACVSVSFFYEVHKIVWFVQPGSDMPDVPSNEHSFIHLVHGLLESVQISCRTHLAFTVSLIMNSKRCKWEAIGETFDRLNSVLYFGAGSENGLLLIDQSSLQQIFKIGSGLLDEELWEFRQKIRKISNLDACLDSGNKASFKKMFSDIMDANMEKLYTLSASFCLEISMTTSLFFLSYMNRRAMMQKISARIDLNKLHAFDKYNSWEEFNAYFTDLAECIFYFIEEKQGHSTTYILSLIHDFMNQRIGEVTVSRLSELVSLNPSYLSRLYKKMTGSGLTEAIHDLKITKAKEMLRNPHMQIQEITRILGFESASYFTLFFKKQTGITPKEYRQVSSFPSGK